MLNVIISVIIGLSIYNTIENIKTSIKNKTIEQDVELKWKKFKEDLYYVKITILRKENKK